MNNKIQAKQIYEEHEFNIVIIDDEAPVLNLLKAYLSDFNLNLKIHDFSNSEQGYYFILENKENIDLILIDWLMPGKTGIDICKLLKGNETTVHIPVIMLTAKTQTDDMLTGFDAGVDDYIFKPYNSRILMARINSALKRRFYQLQVKKQSDELNYLNNLKDKLLSMVSHDIRNNLTGIIGHCHLISMQKYGMLDIKYLKSLNIILKRSKNINNLIDNIINASRMESGNLILNLFKVDLNEFIEIFYNDILTLYSFENYEIKLDADSSNLTVFIDSYKIDEVLTNLVNNAIKFSPANSKITIGFKDYNTDFALCYVKDTGYGIPEQDIPNLFSRFSNTNRELKNKINVRSSGLGLSICKGIIEKHNGKIWVESEVEKGSTFYFTLPKNNLS